MHLDLHQTKNTTTCSVEDALLLFPSFLPSSTSHFQRERECHYCHIFDMQEGFISDKKGQANALNREELDLFVHHCGDDAPPIQQSERFSFATVPKANNFVQKKKVVFVSVKTD